MSSGDVIEVSLPEPEHVEIIGGSFFCDHEWGNKQNTTSLDYFALGVHKLVVREFCQEFCGAERQQIFRIEAEITPSLVQIDVPVEPTEPEEEKHIKFSCLSDHPGELLELATAFRSRAIENGGRWLVSAPVSGASFLWQTLADKEVAYDLKREED